MAISTLLAPASLLPPASASDRPSRKSRFSLPSSKNILHYPKSLAVFSILIPVALLVSLIPVVVVGTIRVDEAWSAFATLDGLMGDAIVFLKNSNEGGLTGTMIVNLLQAEKEVRRSGWEVILAWERVWCVYATFVVVELAVSFLLPSFHDRELIVSISGLPIRLGGVLWSTSRGDEGNSRSAISNNDLSQRRHSSLLQPLSATLRHLGRLRYRLRSRNKRQQESRKSMFGLEKRWNDHSDKGEESCRTQKVTPSRERDRSTSLVARSLSRTRRHDWNYRSDGRIVPHRRVSVISSHSGIITKLETDLT